MWEYRMRGRPQCHSTNSSLRAASAKKRGMRAVTTCVHDESHISGLLGTTRLLEYRVSAFRVSDTLEN